MPKKVILPIPQGHAEGDAERQTLILQKRRQHILDTARSLFIRHGFHRTTMKEIALAADMAVGNIYRIFSGKDELVAHLCDVQIKARLNDDALNAALDRQDEEAAEAWLNDFCIQSVSLDDARMMMEIMAEASRNPRIADITRRCRQYVRSRVQSALDYIGCDLEPDTLCDMVLSQDLMQVLNHSCEASQAPILTQDLIVRTIEAARKQVPALEIEAAARTTGR